MNFAAVRGASPEPAKCHLVPITESTAEPFAASATAAPAEIALLLPSSVSIPRVSFVQNTTTFRYAPNTPDTQGTLTVDDLSRHKTQIKFNDSYVQSNFHIKAENHGDRLITDPLVDHASD